MENIFTFESTLDYVEASIYENHSGCAETIIFPLKFENGEVINTKIKMKVKIEKIKFADETAKGEVSIKVKGNSTVEFINEDQEVMFKGYSEIPMKNTKLVVNNNLFKDFLVKAQYNAKGVNEYEGCSLSGSVDIFLDSFDESMMGVYKLKGEGIIKNEH